MARLTGRALDVVRGGAMGVAEVIPGVSGGTVALLVGVYSTLIDSIATIIRALRSVFSPRSRAADWQAVTSLPWPRLISLILGMGVALVLAAAVIEPLIETYPEYTRALFAGLIVASLAVPLRMIGWPLRPGEPLLMVLVGGAVFVSLGAAPIEQASPEWWMIVTGAAVAICALVLPGVSGSFLLLTLGLYTPTIQAVNQRDIEYLALFAAGALVGLGSFVLVLQWLLQRARRLTLVVMTGLLLGSLRALWPWQSDNRDLLAADPDQLGLAIGLSAAGVALVWGIILLENVVRRRRGA